jgi:hypothetical protein
MNSAIQHKTCVRCGQQPRLPHIIYCVGCEAVTTAEFHRVCNVLADYFAALARARGDEAEARRIEHSKRNS